MTCLFTQNGMDQRLIIMAKTNEISGQIMGFAAGTRLNLILGRYFFESIAMIDRLTLFETGPLITPKQFFFVFSQ